MSKSLIYIFLTFFIFAGNLSFGQKSEVKSPTRSDNSLSETERHHLNTTYQPQIGRSNLTMPDKLVKLEPGKSVLDSRGTEFWLMFPRNYDGADFLFLDITSVENATGNVSIAGLGFSANFSVVANTVTRVDIPVSSAVFPSGSVGNLGIKVTSDKEITVYGMSQRGASSDGFLGLPVDILGNQYLVVTYPILTWGGFLPSESTAPQFSIVSPYDNNVVTITPRDQTVNGNPAGVPFSVTLNQGQTYLVRGRMSNAYSADQTGSFISSTLPVAVFSGSSCASVPQNIPACDHLVEQIPPISTWGKTFVTRPLETRTGGDTWRFLASQDNTQLVINGVNVATLNFGDFYETMLSTRSFVESSNPILVVQISNSSDWDGVVSDPFMMIIPPYQQYLDSYSFSTPASGFVGNYFTSAVDDDGVDGMRLDGSPLNPASFTTIGATGFSAAAFPININTSYNISNNEAYPSGLYVYGFGDYDSYGFPGGLSLISINSGSGPVIELTSATIDLFCTSISTSVTVNISALISDEDEPFVQTATLFWRKAGDEAYQTVNMVKGLNDSWSASIEASATEFPGLDFYISATDGQISTTSPSVDPANNPYSLGIDNLPPQITHTPVVQAPVGADVLISADVTDETESLQSVSLYYRIAGGTPFYTMLSMSHTFGDTYEATIPGVQMTAQGIEYYIKATDNYRVSCFYGLADLPLEITGGTAQNIAPVPVGFPAVAPQVFVGDTYSLSVQFQSPEAGQTTNVVVNAGGLPGFSATVTPGNVAEVDFSLVGQNENVGTHIIEFIATDDGSPALSTVVEFEITVTDNLEGHVICIPKGWSGISSYNSPENPAMEAVFASLVADNKVGIVLGDGGFYWPSQNINTLTSGWDVKKGYKIKMNVAGCLGIVGEMPVDKSFIAKKGVSYIPVLCDQPVPAVDIFSQFGNDFTYAFDIYAQKVYWPAGGLYTLENLEPGVGYLVGMVNQGQATYTCSRSVSPDYTKAQPPVYENAPWSYNQSGSVHFISISTSAYADLTKGDFIGVFDAAGVCAGFTQYNGENGNILLAAYGDDLTTNAKDGMDENQEMTFKIYHTAEKVELPAEVTFNTSLPNTGVYSENGQSMILKMSTGAASVNENKLNQIRLHPNPSTGIFNMDIPAVDQPIDVQVMNVAGQVIYSNSVENNSNSTIKIDLNKNAKGVYFVKITDSNETVVKKVVIK
jgi:hypothetical protein